MPTIGFQPTSVVNDQSHERQCCAHFESVALGGSALHGVDLGKKSRRQRYSQDATAAWAPAQTIGERHQFKSDRQRAELLDQQSIPRLQPRAHLAATEMSRPHFTRRVRVDPNAQRDLPGCRWHARNPSGEPRKPVSSALDIAGTAEGGTGGTGMNALNETRQPLKRRPGQLPKQSLQGGHR